MKTILQKLFFVTLTLLCVTNATAHDFEVDGIYYNILSETEKTVEVTYRGPFSNSYSNEYTGSVVIPTTVKYNNVTYGVTSIGSYAFEDCTGLESVTIGNSVTSIGYGAFRYCTGLKKIELNCATIGSWFSGLSSIEEVVIGNSVTSIGYRAFRGCTGLASVKIPNSVTIIGDSAFEDCSGLTSVTIGNSVTIIGDSAFDGCYRLTNVTIPNSVTSIGSYAFDGCTSLKELYIEDGESILSLGCNDYSNYGGEGLFYDCPLETLYIGRNLSYNEDFYYEDSYYGYSPFCNIETLTSVTIGNSVTSIGQHAFRDCTGLASVTIGNSVTSIGDYAFDACTGLKKIELNCATIGSWFSGLSSIEEVVIGNSVTSIGSSAFRDCSGLTSIIIGNSVTSIGGYAFSGCTGLTSIEIPNSVTSIGWEAFNACTGLTSITIPNSVTSIGSSAFFGCSGLKEVHISDLVAWCRINFGGGFDTNPLEYAHNLYLNGELVTDLVIPEGISEIKNSAFRGYTGLTSVTIPNSVTSIGSYAFEDCTGLTSITIPNSVTSIGDYAFYGCSGLTSIEIPGSVTSIGDYAFYNCSGLTSVTIPNSVTSIGGRAFSGCSGLTSIIIGNRVRSIGDGAFYNCSGLTSVTIPNSVRSIGDGAFYNCSGLKEVHISDLEAWCNIEFDEDLSNPLCYAHNLYLNGKLVTDLVIPDGISEIKNYVFYNCDGLASVTIPNSVTSIGDYAFYNCSGLTSIEIPNSVTSIGYEAFDGCTGLKTVFNFSNLTLTKGSYNYGCVAYYADNVYNAPNGSIEGDFIFGKPNKINTLVGYLGSATELTLPAYYKGQTYVVGDGVFSGCTGLTSVTIPNSVTSIGDRAFYDCSGLTSIEIPNSVTSIGYEAFDGCTRLKTVFNFSNLTLTKGSYNYGYVAYYADNVYNAPNGSIEGDFVFGKQNRVNTLLYYLGNDTHLDLPVNYKVEIYAIGDNVFKNCTTLESITIPNSVISIGNNTFSGCSGLTSIIIGNGVTSIGNNAFSGCSGLTSIIIGNRVRSIGDSAFDGCSGLTSVTIPNSVTSIGNNAFRGCYHLASVIIGNSITSIGDSAFSGCSGLTSVTIPNSVTSIGDYAFYDCDGLASVIIGNSVTSIGYRAFYSCSRLISVIIGNSVTSIGYEAFDGCTGLKTVFNFSNLTLTKGSHNYGYVAYYADNVYNFPNGSIEGDFIFGKQNGINTLLYYLGNGAQLDLPVNYKGENYMIGDNVFKKCATLESITIPNSVTSIGNSVFEGCSGLTSVTIPNSVTSIGNSAFKGCSGLSSITIPNSIINIGSSAFLGCIGLKEVRISNLATWCRINFKDYGSNPLFYAHNLYLNGKLVTDLVIPEGISEIKNSAFSGCTGLTSVTIPISVTSIGYRAFYDCTGLTSIISMIPADKLFISGYLAFNNIDKTKCTLYVPFGAKETYATTDGWKDFVNIVEIVKTFQITFIVDDTVFATDSIAEGSQITYPDVPEKEGYTFCWDTDIDTMPSNDTTITGKYIVNSYLLTYIVDGEVYATDSITYGTTIEPLEEPTKEGHTFSGWSEIPETMPAEDCVIEGAFLINSYTVTFMIDGEVYETITVEYGAVIELPEAPEKEGYVFSGWVGVPETMPAEDIVIEGSFDVDTTGINAIDLDLEKNVVYDLNGLRITETENLTRGIYIINGKKVFVK